MSGSLDLREGELFHYPQVHEVELAVLVVHIVSVLHQPDQPLRGSYQFLCF